MATVADILAEMYRRTRDLERAATPEEVGIAFVSRAQQVLNLYTKSVVPTAPLSLAPGRLVYQIMGDFPVAASIESISYLSRDLTEVPWTEFWRIRHTWFRATGDAPQHWAKIGRNLFVVYPAPLTSLVVEITYVAILDTVTRLTDAILLRNEFLPLLLDLVEALFLFRLRYFGEGPTDPFDVVLQRLQSHMGIGKGAT